MTISKLVAEYNLWQLWLAGAWADDHPGPWHFPDRPLDLDAVNYRQWQVALARLEECQPSRGWLGWQGWADRVKRRRAAWS